MKGLLRYVVTENEREIENVPQIDTAVLVWEIDPESRRIWQVDSDMDGEAQVRQVMMEEIEERLKVINMIRDAADRLLREGPRH